MVFMISYLTGVAFQLLADTSNIIEEIVFDLAINQIFLCFHYNPDNPGAVCNRSGI